MKHRISRFLDQKKIKHKFLYLVLPFVTLGFILIISIVYISFFVYTRQLIDQQMRYTMNEKLSQVSSYFDELYHSSEYLLYHSDMQDMLRIRQKNLSPDEAEHLKNKISSHIYESITQNGLPLKSQYIKAVIIQNMYQELFVTNAMYSSKIEEIVSSVKSKSIEQHGKPYLFYRSPSDLYFCRAVYGGHIYDWDSYLGICLIQIDTHLLNDLIHTAAGEPVCYSIMEASDSVIMNDTSLTDNQVLQLAQQKALHMDKEEYTAMKLPITDTSLSLIAIINKSNFYRQYYHILYIIIITAVIAVVCAYVSILTASNTISKQFQVIIQKLKSTNSLNEHTTIPVASKDEIGELITVYNDMMERIRKLDQTITEQTISLQLAELKTLRAQINPHFLYNTLACINSMVTLGKNEDASQNIIALSKIMRLNIKGPDYFKIRQEKDYLQQYFVIQKTLYENRIIFLLEFDSDILDFYIPKLILQPLIENAIGHGFHDKTASGMLAVTGSLTNTGILFTVRDNGIGISEQKMNYINGLSEQDFELIYDNNQSFGLINTQLRLKKIYGGSFGLHITRLSPSGTCVEVRIPKHTAVWKGDGK